jgi:hypothetical protein
MKGDGMKLVTSCHDSCGEPAEKKIDSEELALWACLDAWQSMSVAWGASRYEVTEADVKELHPQIEAINNSLFDLCKKASGILSEKYGWNKWDKRTRWTLDEE